MTETNNYDDVGADTVGASAIRTTNTRKEFKVIYNKLDDPKISDNKKEKYLFRLMVLQQKFPHIVADLISGAPRIA